MKSVIGSGSESTTVPAAYWPDGFRFDEDRYAANTLMAVHTHRDARLVLSVQGVTRHSCRKQANIVMPGSLLVIPANEPHADCFCEETRAFIIRIEPDRLERIRQLAFVVDAPASYSMGLPIRLAMRIRREAAAPDSLTPLMLEGLTLELLAEIGRSTELVVEPSLPRWLLHARDFLHEHFMDEISIEQVAAVADIHPSHLMRVFRRRYHVSIGDYVRKLRIEYACVLLSTSDLLPSQIAYKVGFAQQSHFCRTFKALIGSTPTEFRQLSGRATPR